MNRWWQILESGLGGVLIVGAAVLGIQLFPAHAWMAASLGGLAGCAVTVLMQYRSFRKEQRALREKIRRSPGEVKAPHAVPAWAERSNDLAA